MNMKKIQCNLLSFVLLLGVPVSGKTVSIKKVGEFPNFLALSPDGKFAYVTSYGTGELIEVDLKQRAVTRAIPVGQAPLGIALADAGKAAFIACRDTGTVAVVNLETLRAAPQVEDFSDLSQSKVNDLTIQQKLSDMLKRKAIPAPQAGTVFVIFLAPGVHSTLGGLQGGVDYAAYHNFVNLEAGEIHYVVVPFHENADTHSAAATRAFAETALNPNGRGWF